MLRFGPEPTAKLMFRVKFEKIRDCRYEVRASAARPQHSIANAASAAAEPSTRMTSRKRRLCRRGSDPRRHLLCSKRPDTESTMEFPSCFALGRSTNAAGSPNDPFVGQSRFVVRGVWSPRRAPRARAA